MLLRGCSFELSVSSAHGMNRVQLAYDLQHAEAVWGLGVQFRHFNLRNHCIPAFISEQGIGRGAPETQPISRALDSLGGGAGGNDYTTCVPPVSTTPGGEERRMLRCTWQVRLLGFGSQLCRVRAGA